MMGCSPGSGEYETGMMSQWERKCSPRTELYGLQTLPCYMIKCQVLVSDVEWVEEWDIPQI
jgi:hypothetical protein